MRTKFKFLILLTLFWLTLSGLSGFINFIPVLPFILLANFIIIHKLDIFPKKYFRISFIIYFCWLLKEILSSSLSVAKVIWKFKKLKLTSCIINYNTKINDPAMIVTFANSITLTPGTYTIDIHEKELLVHCFSKETKEDLTKGKMELQIEKYC